MPATDGSAVADASDLWVEGVDGLHQQKDDEDCTLPETSATETGVEMQTPPKPTLTHPDEEQDPLLMESTVDFLSSSSSGGPPPAQLAAASSSRLPLSLSRGGRKRKKTTVLAVGASRGGSDPSVGGLGYDGVSTTHTSISNDGVDNRRKSSGSTLNNNLVGGEIVSSQAATTVVEDRDTEPADSDTQLTHHHGFLGASSQALHSNNNSNNNHHMPLELIPPVIPENTSGKPSLRSFCTAFPKPKKPRVPRRCRTASIGTATHMESTGASVGVGVSTGTAAAAAAPLQDNTLDNHNLPEARANSVKRILPPLLPTHQPPPAAAAFQHAGPVVQIVNGEIVLQESSVIFHGSAADVTIAAPSALTMAAAAAAAAMTTGDPNAGATAVAGLEAALVLTEVVEEEAELAIVGATYTSFATGRRARPQTNHWTVPETELFFQALRQVGLDFGTMEAYFDSFAEKSPQIIRKRQRRQLKNKYQAEHTKNPALVERALDPRGRTDIDLSVFQLTSDSIQEMQDAKRLETAKESATGVPGETNDVACATNDDDDAAVIDNANENGPDTTLVNENTPQTRDLPFSWPDNGVTEDVASQAAESFLDPLADEVPDSMIGTHTAGGKSEEYSTTSLGIRQSVPKKTSKPKFRMSARKKNTLKGK